MPEQVHTLGNAAIRGAYMQSAAHYQVYDIHVVCISAKFLNIMRTPVQFLRSHLIYENNENLNINVHSML